MATLQELLASGDLYNPQGTINVAVGGSIADALNKGQAFYGMPGLSADGLTEQTPDVLPQLYAPDIDGNQIPISYKTANQIGWAGVTYQGQPEGTGAGLGQILQGLGIDPDGPQAQYVFRQIEQDPPGGPRVSRYIAPNTWDSIVSNMNSYNAAEDSTFNQNALMGLASVLGAGYGYNTYGAGGTSGATTTGIGEAAAPAIGTELPATGVGTTGATAGGETLFGGVAGTDFAPYGVDAQGFPIESAGIPGSAVTGASGVGGAVNTASNAVNAGTALSRILDGTASKSDWLSVLGTAGATGLGVYSANRQTDSLNALANQYAGYGAPYRQRLSDLYANPSGFLSSPEVQVPVQQGTDAAARALSAKVGNPVFSGTALQELQNYSANQLFGKLGQEKDRLAGFGGLSNYSAAAPGVATNAINSSGNALTTLAGGISDIVNPRQSLTDLMKMFQGNNLFGVA